MAKKVKNKNILWFLVASLCITYVIPNDQNLFLPHSEGSKWTDPTLVAPFSFPIYKTDQEYRADCERILSTVIPFYREAKDEGNKQIRIFREKAKELLHSEQISCPIDTFKKIEQHVLELLTNIYNKGIRQLTSDDALYFGEHNKSFYVVDGNMLSVKQIDDSYTQKTAYDEINEKLSNFTCQELIRSLSLFNYLSINLLYDKVLTERKREEALNDVARTKNFIAAGEILIKEGETITTQRLQILESLQKETQIQVGFTGNNITRLIAKFLLTLSILLIYYVFLLRLYRPVLYSVKSVLLILLLFVTAFTFIALIYKFTNWNVYLFPVMIFPVFISSFFDSRMTLNFYVILCILIQAFIPNGFEYFLITLGSGIATIHLIKNIHLRKKLYRTAIVLVCFYALLFTLMSLFKYGNFRQIDYVQYFYFLFNGLFIIAIFPFTYILEKLFGISGDGTLLELCDTNHPLLRKLSEIAPATFQHSMQVANLAEAVAVGIGGNPLLARAGALYHDVGKMNNPAFFIENQDYGFNIHKELDYHESAKMILQHVTDGEKIAKHYNIPMSITRFIRSHHGTSHVMYFYVMAKEENGIANEGDFSYPGPLPTCKEEIIVMMADAIEAASRALENKTMRALIGIVEQVVDKQLHENQYIHSEINFKDIEIAKNIFKRKLQNIYHNRKTS